MLLTEVLVQVSYAIGVAAPVSLLVNTFGTQKVELTEGEISTKVSEIFDMQAFRYRAKIKIKKPNLQKKLHLTDT